MRHIDNLDLDNNTKVDQGFKDGAGLSNISDVNFDVYRLDINKENGTLTMTVQFEANNFSQLREFTWQASDLSNSVRQTLLDILDDSMGLLINESEFKNKTTEV